MLADVDPGSALIWAAYLTAGPAALAAFAAWRSSLQSKRATEAMKEQLVPSNGKRLAEIIEKTERDVREVKDDLAYHISVQHGRGPIPQEVEER